MVTNLSGNAKTPEMVTVICSIKSSLTCTKVLGFVACTVTSKVLVIGSAERYWGDVKTIKSGKRSAIISDVSEIQSIVYKSACIESDITEKYNLD